MDIVLVANCDFFYTCTIGVLALFSRHGDEECDLESHFYMAKNFCVPYNFAL